MRKSLFALSLVLLSSQGFAKEVSNEEILQKLQQLEQKVSQLEEENKKLKSLLKKSGYTVTPRKRTEKLQVDGRVLFRFSQAEDLDEGEKTIYGDPGNGFLIRKARVRFHGKLNDNTGYMIHIRSDRGSNVERWDAYVDYKFDSIPISLKMGQFKVPLSMSYLKSGTTLWFPERPITVNKIAPVWRNVGIAATYVPLKNLKFAASILNGEGWSSNDKIYNKDKKYLYTFAVDTVPVNNEDFRWRVRAGYETGYDRYSKLVYTAYGASVVKRNLFDVETRLDIKPLGLAFEGGYLYDNPTDAKDSSGNPVNLGNAKGFYIQGDYAVPTIKGLHLVGRYSWLDPNDNVDDKNDVDYTSVGFYYLLNGWQAAVRSAYIWANERHGDEIANNLFVTEFQLLF
ncbi:MAG: porin [Desulfurobacteriaceae bacterium]